MEGEFFFGLRTFYVVSIGRRRFSFGETVIIMNNYVFQNSMDYFVVIRKRKKLYIYCNGYFLSQIWNEIKFLVEKRGG